jgi:hypothetical protein
MEPPIVCTLGPDALRVRREGLLADLVRRAESQDEVPNGVRLRFTSTTDTLETLAQVIEAERHCCRFLRFTIDVDPDGGPISLELTGPPGAREFLSALLEG